jgi:hypothetical protein
VLIRKSAAGDDEDVKAERMAVARARRSLIEAQQWRRDSAPIEIIREGAAQKRVRWFTGGSERPFDAARGPGAISDAPA